MKSSGLTARLEREGERLTQLTVTTREARQGLAELTLSGGGGHDSVAREEGRLRSLTDAATQLKEALDETST